jgi:hypothetical protein
MFLDTNVNPKFQDVGALKMPWAKPNFNQVRLITFVKCHFFPKLKRKTRFLWPGVISLRNMLIKGKHLMVSGLWIQNVGLKKMKLFMFNCQQ